LQKVLLTNSTGFVGGATVARLLSSTDAEVVAVVRAHSRTEGEARVHASIARFGLSAPVLLRRLRVLREGPGTPLDRVERVELSDVTHVVDAPAQASSTARDDVHHQDGGKPHACAARVRALPRLERFLTVGRAWICGASPSHVVHEREKECPEALAVVDRLASSVLGLLAQPRLAHARYRLWAGAEGGAFDASIDACVAPRVIAPATTSISLARA
jgi:hypothetical protein